MQQSLQPPEPRSMRFYREMFVRAHYRLTSAEQFGRRVQRWAESGLDAQTYIAAAPGKDEFKARRAAIAGYLKIRDLPEPPRNPATIPAPSESDLLPPIPRIMPPPPGTPTAEQMHAWLRALQGINLTAYTSAVLIYSTGIRAAEFESLRLDDLRLDDRELLVRGKGGKERWVVFGRVAQNALRYYLRVLRPIEAVDTERLFIERGQPYTATRLRAALHKAATAAGITEPLMIIHGLRHACATHLRQGGMNIRYIQALLGHESLDETARYLQLTKEELRAELLPIHPGEDRALVEANEWVV